jgi:hypothetical protein
MELLKFKVGDIARDSLYCWYVIIDWIEKDDVGVTSLESKSRYVAELHELEHVPKLIRELL